MIDRSTTLAAIDSGLILQPNPPDPKGISSKSSPDNIKTPEKPYSSQNIYKEKYQKLSQAVKVAFLSIKRRVIREDQACNQALKDSIPFQEEDEASVKRDPTALVQYVKKIYEKTTELRLEEKKKLIESNEKSMGQYEPLLQKLEAEVRKHIQIEHQMKIIIENQQERIGELEVGEMHQGDNSEFKVGIKEKDYAAVVSEKDKKIEQLEAENKALKEQLKKSQAEAQGYKAGLNGITQIVKGLGIA